LGRVLAVERGAASEKLTGKPFDMLRAESFVERPGHLGQGLHIASVCQKCQRESPAVQNLTISGSLSKKKSFKNQLRTGRPHLA